MSIVTRLKGLLEGVEGSDRSTTGESAGAFWCDDCGVRLAAVEAEEEEPSCPECGGEMRFERSPNAAGCAC